MKPRRKLIASFFLILLTIQTVTPSVAYALTGGPAQPEAQQFQPISASELVDLSTGDFSYSIPLLDVGGYPVTLSYSANNTGMEDEATNVGLGWNINIGAITRQLRGVPDDFKGDKLSKYRTEKPMESAMVDFSFNLEALGVPLPFDLMVGSGVGWNNRTGYYGTMSIRPSLSASVSGGGKLTASLAISSSSKDGASIAPSASFSCYSTINEKNFFGLNAGTSFNSRKGLRNMTLGMSGAYRPSSSAVGVKFDNSQTIDFVGNDYYPVIDWPRKIQHYMLDLSLGPTAYPMHFYGKANGAYSKQELSQHLWEIPTFGTLYQNSGRDNKQALLDFNREKDDVFHPGTPNMPVPVFTPDIFSVTSHIGSSQFTFKSGSSGIFRDPKVRSSSLSLNGGFEFGAGPGSVKILSGNLGMVNSSTVVGKWENGNIFQQFGDFSGEHSEINYEPVYARKVGTLSPLNGYIASGKLSPRHVKISPFGNGFGAAPNLMESKNSVDPTLTSPLKRTVRETRQEEISYLTAEEASKYGGGKLFLRSSKLNEPSLAGCNTDALILKMDNYLRKPHHLSEIRVTNADGKRLVYGLPVYNVEHNEYTFSAEKKEAEDNYIQKGLFDFPNTILSTKKSAVGTDELFQVDRTAPYAHSFLLTQILSPDYVDVGEDGITDDDHGEAIKFNYTKVSSRYGYRSPMRSPEEAITLGNRELGSFNEGMKSDPKDDKVSFIEGSKEVWNVHSIESKSFYALFIYDNASGNLRKDMLGYLNGHQPGLYRLKEIRLYSKEDLKLNGMNGAVPIKTVVFEHDYSFSSNLPNATSSSTGKMKLTKLYFTYGRNKKGQTAPYAFQYSEVNPAYAPNSMDRWGNYKSSVDNPGLLNNLDYPYSTQDKTLADLNASVFKLNKISLPTGGEISVEYESDDYGYVQNKRAMRLFSVKGIGSADENGGLINADRIIVETQPDGSAATAEEFKKKYIGDQKFLFYKMFVDLDAKGHSEYIEGYAKIKNVEGTTPSSNQYAIIIEKTEKVNPVAFLGWQILRQKLPQYAYDNYVNPKGGMEGIVRAIMTSASSILELLNNFPSKAEKKGFCNKVTLDKSFVRLCDPDFKKYGGNHRVKQVQINDNWNIISTSGRSLTQTIKYYYTMTNAEGQLVSSGVASYEPMIGGQENPWKQPVQYKESVPFILPELHTLELPMGESYFPAPVVVYQQVKVAVFGDDGYNSTGYTVNEFYTSRDFPTLVSQTPLSRMERKPGFILLMMNINIHRSLGLSQGYKVELNDMHGKPKSVKIYDKGEALVSSTTFHYKSESIGSNEFKLVNEVDLVENNGNISSKVIGVDTDMYHDMRHEIAQNDSYELQANFQPIQIGIWVIPFYSMFQPPNRETNEYYGSSSILLINRTGILDRVIKTENGSIIQSKNLLWDAETGEALLTQTINEFEDPIYNFHYPAHWAYEKMGGAYKNIGLVIKGISTDQYGNLPPNIGLSNGDEVIDINVEGRYLWVLYDPVTSKNKLIDKTGNSVTLSNSNLKVIRSSFRNILSASTGNIISLDNPVKNGKIDIGSFTKVINASATTFNDEWAVPSETIKTRVPCVDCPAGFNKMESMGSNSLLKMQFVSLPADSTNWCESTTTDSVSDIIGVGCEKTFYKYGSAGAKIYSQFSGNGNGTFINAVNASFWKSRVDVAGIWRSCTDYSSALPLKVKIPVFSPVAKPYYVGISADNRAKLIVNENVIVDRSSDNYDNYESYHIYPVNFVAGTNWVTLIGTNSGDSASLSAEVYNNLEQDLIGASTSEDLDLVFSTSWLKSKFLGTYYPIKFEELAPEISCGLVRNSHQGLDIKLYFDLTKKYCYDCQNDLDKIINPFYIGVKGNWRPEAQWVFKENREQPVTKVTGSYQSNIRSSGYLKYFTPFWSSTNLMNPSQWIQSNAITLYNLHGDELENKNALGLYSSALFGFNNLLPVAVASNAANNQLAFESFEDVQLSNSSCKPSDSCYDGGVFKIRRLLLNFPNVASLNTKLSHSGMTSLSLTGNASITWKLIPCTEGAKYTLDPNGFAILKAPGIQRGFSPEFEKDKKYIFSGWALDQNANRSSTEPGLTFSFSTSLGNLQSEQVKWGPIIDGWRKFEVIFYGNLEGLPDYKNFTLGLNASGQLYLDDMRIFPYTGQMKSYAYNPRTFKLMAELDENNYASFYEYDDEGTLIRVKKETERGILTIKETRSYQRNSNP